MGPAAGEKQQAACKGRYLERVCSMYSAIWLSFSDQMVGVAGHFVGLKNFRSVITWPQFTAALYNTGVFTIVVVMCKFVLGMAE